MPLGMSILQHTQSLPGFPWPSVTCHAQEPSLIVKSNLAELLSMKSPLFLCVKSNLAELLSLLFFPLPPKHCSHSFTFSHNSQTLFHCKCHNSENAASHHVTLPSPFPSPPRSCIALLFSLHLHCLTSSPPLIIHCPRHQVSPLLSPVQLCKFQLTATH